MVTNHGLIIHKTGHKKGKRHDYGIYKKSPAAAPKQVVRVSDIGYLGGGSEFPDQKSSIPNRKRTSQKDLCHEEKEYNQHQSRKRMMIESTPFAE
jgi:hypothetical protein